MNRVSVESGRMTIRLRVISLGAGVQSTAMALMAAHGEITPMPDFAIFADTMAEPRAVYDHLIWLKSALPFEVVHVTAGNLFERVVKAVEKEASNPVPFWTDGRNGGRGQLQRNCTRDYKITPIARELRKRLGKKPQAGAVEKWIGISTDEATRMKPAREPWATHRWPLVELRMDRNDCLRWMERHDYPKPPKSACWFCPYMNKSRLRHLRDNHPIEWREAVILDRQIRSGFRGSTRAAYLSDSLQPLSQVDLSTSEDRGQLNLFNNECEGMCGV